MPQDFLGKFEVSVNKQKWITIPTAFKKNFTINARSQVVITIGPRDTLVIYPLDKWQEKVEELKGGNDHQRALLNNIQELATEPQKLDTAGRVKVSDELLGISGIGSRVVLKGNGRYITVWKPESYAAYIKQQVEAHRKRFSAEDYQ
ncbi:MAG: protein MraZ [Candidatus Cloacimonetes bacterium]|nr:protein MraZ [Candidatus Cloacimonadota bacterium]